MPEQACVQIAENLDKNIQTAPKAGNDLSQAFIAFIKNCIQSGKGRGGSASFYAPGFEEFGGSSGCNRQKR